MNIGSVNMSNHEKILIFRSLLIILSVCKYLVGRYLIDITVHRFIAERVDGLTKDLADHVNYLSSQR